jgi:VWFA-related protein
VLAVILAVAAAIEPLAIRVETQALGHGQKGTVVGVAVQVAPEDRARVGARIRVSLALTMAGKVVDAGDAVVELAPDGGVLLYREWPSGEGELAVGVQALAGEARGGWRGKVAVPVLQQPFEAGPGAAADAVALAASPPAAGTVQFVPPGRGGGVGALQLEVTLPEGAASVEFFQDGELLVRRQRPPWTVSVSLGNIAHKTVVRAAAYDAAGSFLGEDALVLNAPASQLPLAILLGPEPPTGGSRTVTVAATGARELTEVVLRADDVPLARWTSCPCVARVASATLKQSKVLSAVASNAAGQHGEAVLVLGAVGYKESVRVETVELPVTVLDQQGRLVTDLARDDFRVLEDGREVALESFSRTEDLPLSLGILVDTSGSMRKTFPDVRKAVAGFAQRLLRPGDRFFLMTFSFEPRMQFEWTARADLLADALERVTPDGGTSLYDALVRALALFRGGHGRAALVLLSDGDDTTSRTGWDVTLRYAKTVRIPVFTIGFKISALDIFIRDRLKNLGAATGAEVFFTSDAAGLESVYRRIDRELRAQYLLTYRSQSSKSAGDFRTVRVETTRSGLVTRTIAGYYPME